MVCRLYQAYRSETCAVRALEHCLHQPSTDGAVLHVWIDGDRPDPCDRISFPEEVAAHDAAANLCNQAMHVRAGCELAQEFGGDVCAGKVRREIVALGDGLERFVADPSDRGSVGGSGGAYRNAHVVLLPPTSWAGELYC